MAVEISQTSPLAVALHTAIQPKLAELGWSTGSDDSALGEYIILMLVNGKTQDQVAAELSEDLLGLGPGDASTAEFSNWLFEQVNSLNAQMNGGANTTQDSTVSTVQDAGQVGTEAPAADMDMDEAGGSGAGTIPTGPKAMRNGNANPREKRMIGNINKALDRSADNPLHRVRGASSGAGRINSHSREAPKGPRSRLNRNIQQMANGMHPMPMQQMQQMMPGAMGPGMPSMMPDQQMELLAYWEQGARMMQQLMANGSSNGPIINPAFQRGNQTGPGKSLFDRVQKGNRQGGNSNNNRQGRKPPNQDSEMGGIVDYTAKEGSGMDFALSQPSKVGETRCKFDLSCTNAECKFVHQSPAAPRGTVLDMGSDCSFGAACKNHKCVGKHPSPAQRLTFQSENDCDWGPLCTNTSCKFRHSSMPACRNGGDCAVESCKFAHTRIKCNHKPCTRPSCAYKHDEGQKRGKFEDKVWTPNDQGEMAHVSERKFVDEDGEEELIIPGHQPSTPTPVEPIAT